MTVVNFADFRLPETAKIKTGLGLMIVIAPTGIGSATMGKLVDDLRAVLERHEAIFARSLSQVPHTRLSPALGPVLLPGRHFTTDLTTTRSIKVQAQIGVWLTVRWALGMEADAITAMIHDIRNVLRCHSGRRPVGAAHA